MQQITQHSSHSLFFVNFYVCGAMGGSLFYYEPKQAVKSSPFLSRNIILPPEGVIVESAPSRPNRTRPEVNGPGGAHRPGAPEPSRHTTGRGCRHPPVKRLLPAVMCFFLSHPSLQSGSHWNPKKSNRMKMENRLSVRSLPLKCLQLLKCLWGSQEAEME